MDGGGNLEDQARKRKERLMALRKKQQNDNRESDEDEPPLKKSADAEIPEEEETKRKEPAFKNYVPGDDKLKEKVQPKAGIVSVEEHIKDQLEASKPQPVVEEVDLNNLAPRKPDWDLKRDVASKLEKLERRTQRAIAELIRERLQSGKGDLVEAVNAAEAQNEPSRGEYEEDYD